LDCIPHCFRREHITQRVLSRAQKHQQSESTSRGPSGRRGPAVHYDCHDRLLTVRLHFLRQLASGHGLIVCEGQFRHGSCFPEPTFLAATQTQTFYQFQYFTHIWVEKGSTVHIVAKLPMERFQIMRISTLCVKVQNKEMHAQRAGVVTAIGGFVQTILLIHDVPIPLRPSHVLIAATPLT
jgi:hypothetical protein